MVTLQANVAVRLHLKRSCILKTSCSVTIYHTPHSCLPLTMATAKAQKTPGCGPPGAVVRKKMIVPTNNVVTATLEETTTTSPHTGKGPHKNKSFDTGDIERVRVILTSNQGKPGLSPIFRKLGTMLNHFTRVAREGKAARSWPILYDQNIFMYEDDEWHIAYTIYAVGVLKKFIALIETILTEVGGTLHRTYRADYVLPDGFAYDTLQVYKNYPVRVDDEVMQRIGLFGPSTFALMDLIKGGDEGDAIYDHDNEGVWTVSTEYFHSTVWPHLKELEFTAEVFDYTDTDDIKYIDDDEAAEKITT
jgi:hypothetical protein